jgi:DNA-binding CsgD family transcriptional regulator
MINGEGQRAPTAGPLGHAAFAAAPLPALQPLAWVGDAQRGKHGTLERHRAALDVSRSPPPAARAAEGGAPQAAGRDTFGAIASDNLGIVVGQLALEKQGAVLIGAALGALGIAAFICDGLALVCALTPVAQAALASGRVRLVNGRLSAPHHYDAADMEAAIAAATSLDLLVAGPTTRTIVNRNPRHPASAQVVDVIALPRHPLLSSFEPRAIVVLRGGEQTRSELEPILTRAFGLTPAEAQVAARLANGEAREMIAAERGASLQTVRSQIKSIFAKLNVTRERELVSMLARITQR